MANVVLICGKCRGGRKVKKETIEVVLITLLEVVN
jgi:hypothetical protein